LWIAKENAHLIELGGTEDEQGKQKELEERYTAHGASGVWRVHPWRVECFLSVLGDTEDHDDISGHCYIELALTYEFW
jgi:hypothetical protein